MAGPAMRRAGAHPRARCSVPPAPPCCGAGWPRPRRGLQAQSPPAAPGEAGALVCGCGSSVQARDLEQKHPAAKKPAAVRRACSRARTSSAARSHAATWQQQQRGAPAVAAAGWRPRPARGRQTRPRCRSAGRPPWRPTRPPAPAWTCGRAGCGGHDSAQSAAQSCSSNTVQQRQRHDAAARHERRRAAARRGRHDAAAGQQTMRALLQTAAAQSSERCAL